MVETFFLFKKTPFSDSPDAKQLFASQSWSQIKARLQFLVEYHGAGLLTGEVGSGKSTAARSFTAALNPNLFKVMYLYWTLGSTLDLLHQVALELDLEPAHYRGDLIRQISQAIVRLNQSKKQHPDSDLRRSPGFVALPDAAAGRPAVAAPLAVAADARGAEALRQRIAVQYHVTWRDSRARNWMRIWRINSRPPA
jgi:hypothetical protein